MCARAVDRHVVRPADGASAAAAVAVVWIWAEPQAVYREESVQALIRDEARQGEGQGASVREGQGKGKGSPRPAFWWYDSHDDTE